VNDLIFLHFVFKGCLICIRYFFLNNFKARFDEQDGDVLKEMIEKATTKNEAIVKGAKGTRKKNECGAKNMNNCRRKQ
jgi:hypothetical protein